MTHRDHNHNINIKDTATTFRSSPDEVSLSSDLLTRSLSDLGQKARSGNFYLSRLLYTRKEAKAILAVTPAGQGMEVLDFQANRVDKGGKPQDGFLEQITFSAMDTLVPEQSRIG